MPVFSQVEHQLPPDIIVVSPSAFSSMWTDRPDEDVTLGLRYVPDGDLEDARVEALRRAERIVPNHTASPEHTQIFVATFQDTLMRWVIARGTCDPNNVHKAWEGWAGPTEDIVVEQALTDHGAQLIYDAWERMRLATNIGLRPASDEDIACLPELMLRMPALSEKSPSQAARLRRLLRYVLEELEGMPAPVAPEAPAPVESDRSDSPSLTLAGAP